jgi:hypothetical protein
MERFLSRSTTTYWWLATLWTGAIVLAFSVPTPSLGAVQPALGLDKGIHAALFAVFGALWMRVLCPPGPARAGVRFRRQAGRLLLLGGLFAGGSEVYQKLLPVPRMADPYDALADAVGLVFGIVLYGAYLRWRAPRTASSPPE